MAIDTITEGTVIRTEFQKPRESPSQFSREYSRLFGAPLADLQLTQAALAEMAGLLPEHAIEVETNGTLAPAPELARRVADPESAFACELNRIGADSFMTAAGTPVLRQQQAR